MSGFQAVPISGGFEVNSVFAEINIPVLAQTPGAQLLEIGAGVRLDDYSTIGSNSAVMLNSRWKPHADLLLRASYSEVFREPTVFDLFTPLREQPVIFQDPCSTGSIFTGEDSEGRYTQLTPEQQARCRQTGVPEGGYEQLGPFPARVGGSADLDPESGDTLTVGLAVSPQALPGMSMTVDYWRVELEEALSQVGGDVVLDQCILRGNLEFCDSITPADHR